jgi:hypothetical protein
MTTVILVSFGDAKMTAPYFEQMIAAVISE